MLQALLNITVQATGVRFIEYLLDYPADCTTLDVPGYRQLETYTCGAIAGLMVLHTFDPDADPVQFIEDVDPCPNRGTSTTRLRKTLRAWGVGSSYKKDLDYDKICSLIDQGFPIITTVWIDEYELHWVVLYGYGEDSVFVAGDGLPLFDAPEWAWEEFKHLWVPSGEGIVCWGL